jgi:hypothetical protein
MGRDNSSVSLAFFYVRISSHTEQDHRPFLDSCHAVSKAAMPAAYGTKAGSINDAATTSRAQGTNTMKMALLEKGSLFAH